MLFYLVATVTQSEFLSYMPDVKTGGKLMVPLPRVTELNFSCEFLTRIFP